VGPSLDEAHNLAMPWRIKRNVYLVILAAAMLAGAIIVWVHNETSDTDLLAALAVVGGLAILIVALPSNGGEKP